MTRTVDYSDRSAAVLWGDGTAAAVLSTREPGRARILGNTLESSPAGHDKVTIPRQGHFLQEGRTVQMFAIKKTVKCYRHLRDGFAEAGRRLHFVGHQANLMMLQKVCELCEIPPELHHSNVRDFGNTAGAGSVGVLSMRWDDSTDGDDVAVAGVGAGLTWSSFLLRFGACPAKTELARPAGRAREVRGLPPALELRPPGVARLRPRAADRGPPEAFAAKLPLPPMLMVDRIEEIRRERHKGRIVAERDVRLDDWFFQCHFLGDPVQPGCLGVDGVWQLVGFFCAWAGGMGTGRALGCAEVEFAGQIRPHDAVMRYEIDVVRYRSSPPPAPPSPWATRQSPSTGRHLLDRAGEGRHLPGHHLRQPSLANRALARRKDGA